MYDAALLFGGGLLAGAMNAVAGGGSFVTLPAMIAVGLPSVAANASSTVALVPGAVASTWVYRAGVGPVLGTPLRPMFAASVVGGIAGALLLLWTPSSVFDLVLPWLLLAATVAIVFGRRIAALLRVPKPRPAVVLAVQAVIGIYGGYFGGAVGLMMLAAWTVMGAPEIKALQGQRTLLVGAANMVASVAFALAGAVWWPQTLAMLAGALAGGFLGARLGRVLPAKATRAFTIATTVSVTTAFFVRAYA